MEDNKIKIKISKILGFFLLILGLVNLGNWAFYYLPYIQMVTPTKIIATVFEDEAICKKYLPKAIYEGFDFPDKITCVILNKTPLLIRYEFIWLEQSGKIYDAEPILINVKNNTIEAYGRVHYKWAKLNCPFDGTHLVVRFAKGTHTPFCTPRDLIVLYALYALFVIAPILLGVYLLTRK